MCGTASLISWPLFPPWHASDRWLPAGQTKEWKQNEAKHCNRFACSSSSALEFRPYYLDRHVFASVGPRLEQGDSTSSRLNELIYERYIESAWHHFRRQKGKIGFFFFKESNMESGCLHAQFQAPHPPAVHVNGTPRLGVAGILWNKMVKSRDPEPDCHTSPLCHCPTG